LYRSSALPTVRSLQRQSSRERTTQSPWVERSFVGRHRAKHTACEYAHKIRTQSRSGMQRESYLTRLSNISMVTPNSASVAAHTQCISPHNEKDTHTEQQGTPV
jgi:hypothetical protein